MSNARGGQRKMERQQRALEEEKQQLREEKRALDQAKRQLAQEKKTFRTEQNRTRGEAESARRQMQKATSRLSAAPSSPRTSRSVADPAKLKRDLDESKRQTRTLRQETEHQQQEIKVLKKRLKRAGRAQKQVRPDKRIKQLEKDAKMMRRKLKLALMDTEKTGAYYRRMLSRFKTGQEQWLREQRANARKGAIIKYVFVEEMKRIHVRRGRNAVRIVTFDNDEAVMKDVEVIFEGEEAVTEEERAAAAADMDNYEDIVEMVNDADLEDEVKEDEEDDEDDDADIDIDDEEDGGVGVMGKQLIAMLYSELNNRIGDLEKFEEITLCPHPGEYDMDASLQTLVAGVQFRQADIEGNFLAVITPEQEEPIPQDEDEDDDEKERATEVEDDAEAEEPQQPVEPNPEHLEWHESLSTNNTEWRDTLLRTRTSARTTVHVQKALMHELKQRIGDVEQLIKIMSGEHHNEEANEYDDDEKDPNMLSLDPIESDVEDDMSHVERLVAAIQQRHQIALAGLQREVQEMATERTAWDDEEIEAKDEDESSETEGSLKEIDEIRASRPAMWATVLAQVRDANDGWRTQLLHGQHIEERQTKAMQTALESSNKMWWIRRDVERNEIVDSLGCVEQELLGEVGVYVNRVVGGNLNPKGLPMTIRNLYLPIVFDRGVAEIASVGHNIVATLYDGVILASLLHGIRPDVLDLRAIHYPDLQDPYPLSYTQVRENISTVLSTCKTLGIRMERHWSVNDYLDPNQTDHVCEDIVRSLARSRINESVNVNRVPELIRLVNASEEKEDDSSGQMLKAITGMGWMTRWVNDKLHREFDSELDVNDWLFDMCSILSVISSENDSAFDGEGARSLDIESCTEMVFDQLLNGLAFLEMTAIPQDIVDGNSLLQDLTLCEVFGRFHGLLALTKDEKKVVRKKVKAKGDDATMAWINSVLDDSSVSNLERDVSDGLVLLKLVDAAKPGCVDWKQVRKNVRHKFDRVNNCNLAVNYCKEILGLVLVGIAGTDLVDGNQKYIRTLLWQIMRYHSVKVLSELQFDGNNVSDDDILAWANNAVTGLGEEARCDLESLPSSFKDKTLTNGIFFLDLINSVRSDAVDWNMVHNIPPLVGGRNRKKDEYESERIANARYVMTVIRRMGGELFVMPEDLVNLDTRAVLSVIAAMMTMEVRIEKDPEYVPPTPRVDHTGKIRKSNAFLFGHLPGIQLDDGGSRGTHGRSLSRAHQRMNSLQASLTGPQGARSAPPVKGLPPTP